MNMKKIMSAFVVCLLMISSYAAGQSHTARPAMIQIARAER
jgi:hypothetical protein